MDNKLQERGEQLIRALSPDRPFYLLTPPAGFPFPDAVHGLAASHDVVLREHLITEGRWKGLAPMIVVAPRLSEEQFLGVVAHESAHCFEYLRVEAILAVEDRDATPEDLQRWRQKHEAFSAHVSSEARTPRWLGAHGPSFIRSALHVHQRAWAAGFEIGLPEMNIAGPQYHLSAAWRYKAALAPELKSMATASMADVLNTEIPRSFLKFFRADAVLRSPFKTKSRLAA